MSLQRLPTELLCLVSESLKQKDISSLISCARRFQVLTSILYGNDFKCHKTSALFWGAEQGVLNTVKMAVHAGGDVNDLHLKWFTTVNGIHRPTNHVQRAPIHLAAFNGHDDVVEYLLECGASLEPLSVGLCHCAALVDRISTAPLFQPVKRLRSQEGIWSALVSYHILFCFCPALAMYVSGGLQRAAPEILPMYFRIALKRRNADGKTH